MHAALRVQRRGFIPDLAHLAVRDVLVVLEIRLLAGDKDHVVHAGDALLDRWIFGIQGFDPVHHERVAVEIGRKRADRRRPDSLVVARQLGGRGRS